MYIYKTFKWKVFVCMYTHFLHSNIPTHFIALTTIFVWLIEKAEVWPLGCPWCNRTPEYMVIDTWSACVTDPAWSGAHVNHLAQHPKRAPWLACAVRLGTGHQSRQWWQAEHNSAKLQSYISQCFCISRQCTSVCGLLSSLASCRKEYCLNTVQWCWVGFTVPIYWPRLILWLVVYGNLIKIWPWVLPCVSVLKLFCGILSVNTVIS